MATLTVLMVLVSAGEALPAPRAKWSDDLSSARAALRAAANDAGIGDPDAAPVGSPVDRVEYLRARAEQIALYRGSNDLLDYNARALALRQFRVAARSRAATGPTWTPIGPAPIPNGQTTPSTAVSGRVTAIAVDPANASKVYVGTAQGGVYRSTDGGTNWTPLMDNAASLAIGALALSADGTKLYVGTGEGNLGGDNYAGVGLYRIDSPGGSFTVNGPFEQRVADANLGTGVGNGHAFKFEAITGIAVDPANPARIYVSSTMAFIGVGGDVLCCASPAAEIGLWRSTNATAATPTFAKVAGNLPADGGGAFFGGTDVMFLPGSSSTLLVGVEDVGFGTTANNGVWRTTTAQNAAPTFTHISLPNSVFNTRLAVGPSSTVLVAAETTLSGFAGRVYKSTDGGANFPTTLTTANGFCGGQCFYDMAPAIDPSNASKMLLGGSADSGGANILMRATDGLNFSSSDAGLHADSHATAYAPSNSSIVYAGNDGGIYKSTDGGATWSSKNNSQFSATQFESVAVHPSDPNFTIGGTQDNGTPLRNAAGNWTRADFGDGGFAAIDQNATNTSSGVTMYHTYFQQKNNLVGYARVTGVANAFDGNWPFIGCDQGFTENNISCTEDPLFYAPLELGPGSPNTVYYGTDRLHRSADGGTTNPVVSQTFAGGLTGRISAIGVAPSNDNVRIVGLNGGGVFGTSSGSSTLDNLDNSGQIPNKYVSRVVIDPNNADVAWVTINGFTGGTSAAQSHVWKTTNINGTSTTWTAKNSGLPDVPVNALVIDPLDSSDVYAGTDIGVFASTDGGNTWAPFGTGLPAVAVFDLAIAAPGTGNEVLRAATHGKGMWDADIGTGGSTFTLAVQKSGTGNGTVVSDDAFINCGATCSHAYSPGETVQLTASPNGTSTFNGFSGGGCSGTGPCNVTMNSNITVTATFTSSDATKPTATMTKPSTIANISKSIPLQWSGSDTGGSGLDDFDVRFRKANFNQSSFGSFSFVVTHTTATSRTFTAPATGATYCFSVRSRDNAGNVSAFSKEKCTAVPVDDKQMTASTGWTRKTGQAGAFLGTLSVASATGKTLKAANSTVRRIGFMVKLCSSCGVVQVLFGTTSLGFADTSGSGFAVFQQPTAFSSLRTGTITLKVASSGKPVNIDGIIVSRVGGSITFGKLGPDVPTKTLSASRPH